MSKTITIIAAFFIFISIILGAIAAHSLEKIISQNLILTFEKGVKYLMYSGLGLLIIGLNHDKFHFKLTWIYRLIILGTVLFCGNIFIYIFHEQFNPLKNFVHLVPIGGTLMIIGWGVLLLKLFKSK
ncbi:MAG: DUF423 domain-containing protein [Crocinitomicaceae bacterium]